MYAGNAPIHKERKELIAKAQITTTIPMYMWKACKEKSLAFNHVFCRGYEVLTDEPQLLKRQKELEETVQKLGKTVEFYRNRMFLLEKQLEDSK